MIPAGVMAQGGADTLLSLLPWRNAYWAGGPAFQALGLAPNAPVTVWPDEVGGADLAVSGSAAYRLVPQQLRGHGYVDGSMTVSGLPPLPVGSDVVVIGASPAMTTAFSLWRFAANEGFGPDYYLSPDSWYMRDSGNHRRGGFYNTQWNFFRMRWATGLYVDEAFTVSGGVSGGSLDRIALAGTHTAFLGVADTSLTTHPNWATWKALMEETFGVPSAFATVDTSLEPHVVGASSAVGNGASITVTPPAAARTGDLLVCNVVLCAALSDAFSTPAGWTLHGERENGGNQVHLGIYSAAYDGSTPSWTWTVGMDAGQTSAAVMYAVRNANTVSGARFNSDAGFSNQNYLGLTSWGGSKVVLRFYGGAGGAVMASPSVSRQPINQVNGVGASAGIFMDSDPRATATTTYSGGPPTRWATGVAEVS